MVDENMQMMMVIFQGKLNEQKSDKVSLRCFDWFSDFSLSVDNRGYWSKSEDY